MHAAHYVGFVVVPLVVFLVGVCEYDLLHAGYLAQLLAYFLSSTAQLEPPLETAVVPMRKVDPLAFSAEAENLPVPACCVPQWVSGMPQGMSDLRVGSSLGCQWC